MKASNRAAVACMRSPKARKPMHLCASPMWRQVAAARNHRGRCADLGESRCGCVGSRKQPSVLIVLVDVLLQDLVQLLEQCDKDLTVVTTPHFHGSGQIEGALFFL